jgi:hypothetical protein
MEKEMKAEHRHELKTNELAQWIANLPQWTKDNLTAIVVVFTVVVLAVFSYYYFRSRKATASLQESLRLTELTTNLWSAKRNVLGAQISGEADVSFLLLQIADRLETFADTAKSDTIAATAFIKRAEALLAEVHYRPGMTARQDLVRQVTLARNSYNMAIERLLGPFHTASQDGNTPGAGGSIAWPGRSLVAAAKFGLGLCEEELGNFDKARDIYIEIISNPDFERTLTMGQVRLRLKTMGDYRKKIVFRAPPRPAPRPMPRPPVTSPDVNLPMVGETNRVKVEVVETNLADIYPWAARFTDANFADFNSTGP